MQKCELINLIDERRQNHRAMQVTSGLAIGWQTEEQSATNQYQQ